MTRHASPVSTRGDVSPTTATPSGESPTLSAYHVPGRPDMDIVPASRWREWMEDTDDRWANRCLPLLMANESGWSLLNPFGFTATWDGGKWDRSLRLEVDDPAVTDAIVASIFGYGIITWSIPFLFHTDPGWNLLARGPANHVKDGVAPLEGLVETDWSTANFTMNWKITRPDLPVRFEVGEPFCTIVPQRRGELEAFTPQRSSLSDDAELEGLFRHWERRREQVMMHKFVSQFGKIDGFDPHVWEQDYFRGTRSDGVAAPEHETKRRLRPFTEAKAA